MTTLNARLNMKHRIAAITSALLVTALPSVAFAEGGAGEPDFLTTAVFQALNLAILFGLGFYFGRQPFSNFLKERRERVTRELEEAKKLHEEARANLADYKRRLDALDGQRDKLLKEYQTMGEKERDRLIEEAQRQADKILRDAQSTVDGEIKRARASLEAEAVNLATAMAEQAIREKMNRDAQKHLVDAFLSDLEHQIEAPQAH